MPVDNKIKMKKLLATLIVFSFCELNAQGVNKNEELKYYPLKTGNYFEYLKITWQMPYPVDLSSYYIKVLGDTLLENGEHYKILLTKNIPAESSGSYSFERIDSLTGTVYRYKKSNSYQYIKNNEYMIDSLFAQLGDTIACSRNGFSSFGFFRTISMSTYLDTLLDFPTEVKEFRDQSFIPGLSYKLAKGLGFYNSSSCEFSCTVTSLVYAKINGNEYGKTITSVDKTESTIPQGFKLYQNYPNPFNPETVIQYSVPYSGIVTVKVYDLLGREIAKLVDEFQNSGGYIINFKSTTGGRQLSSGIYFYRLQSGNFVSTKKMVLMN